MSQYHDLLTTILPEAGKMIMTYRNHNNVIEKEKNEIVTPADIAANEYLVAQLRAVFPAIAIYTEEGERHKSQAATRWIIDPIDGTTPWVWGNSGFAIAMALEQNNEIIVGAVYDPVMKELFYAEKGGGATRNGTPIYPSSETQPETMLMVVDWGNKDEKRREGLAYFSTFMLPTMFARRVVPQFAPALGLCKIAEGRTHALVCNDTWVEDQAAASLILQEAGGFCTNFYNTEGFNHRHAGIIATNQQSTHAQIVQLLAR